MLLFTEPFINIPIYPPVCFYPNLLLRLYSNSTVRFYIQNDEIVFKEIPEFVVCYKWLVPKGYDW